MHHSIAKNLAQFYTLSQSWTSPNAVLLENDGGDLFILLSAAAKPVVAVDCSGVDRMPATDLIFDRNNPSWLARLGEVC